jgi:hypothetical protein
MARIRINRAPVLTLWAAVVAERLGYPRATALTLGKSVAGLNAQSKGQRLGIYEERPKGDAERREKAEPGAAATVALMGREIPVSKTADGLRATVDGKSVDPAGVERYLSTKFGDTLPDARAAMRELAHAYAPRELAGRAYDLYQDFRPSIPEGEKGWGAKGELDLGHIRSLAK